MNLKHEVGKRAIRGMGLGLGLGRLMGDSTGNPGTDEWMDGCMDGCMGWDGMGCWMGRWDGWDDPMRPLRLGRRASARAGRLSVVPPPLRILESGCRGTYRARLDMSSSVRAAELLPT